MKLDIIVGRWVLEAVIISECDLLARKCCSI